MTVVLSESADALQLTTNAITASGIRANFPLALGLSSLAGLSTGIGALGVVIWPQMSPRRLGMWQAGAAGFMISVSAVDLLPAALNDLSLTTSAIAAAVGAGLLLALQAFLPEPDLSKSFFVSSKTGADERAVLWSGLLTAVTLALHNVPEGFAVAAASLRGIEMGAPLALAIGLHNLPEGIAVALPIYYATKSKKTAFVLALLSGLAEPAGVLVMLALLSTAGSVSPSVIAALLASVAGIMTALSFAELIPQARKHCGNQETVLFTSVGFGLMWFLLYAIDRFGVSV